MASGANAGRPDHLNRRVGGGGSRAGRPIARAADDGMKASTSAVKIMSPASRHFCPALSIVEISSGSEGVKGMANGTCGDLDVWIRSLRERLARGDLETLDPIVFKENP